MRICVYNKHAQNYIKYAQNGASTNGTPYKTAAGRSGFKCLSRKYNDKIKVWIAHSLVEFIPAYCVCTFDDCTTNISGFVKLYYQILT